MDRSYNYSVIRLTPDPLRAEVINIGLLVYKDGDIDIKMLPNTTKAKALDGKIDISSFTGLPNTIKKLCSDAEGIEDIARLLEWTGDEFSLSESGWFTTDNESSYDSNIARLMKMLVIPRRSPNRHPSNSRINFWLRSKFRSAKLLSKEGDINQHLVIPNFPISDNSDLVADFAIKNGAFHITSTLDLSAKNTNTKFKEAGLKALTLMDAKQTLGRKTKCYAVYSASVADEKRQLSAMRLLSDHAKGGAYNTQSSTDMAKYFEIIHAAARNN